MKTGVMQPYFLPYIGYWQLLAFVDRYVILDDVSYIRRGWINRNRILVGGKPEYMTIPLCKASQNRKINELELFEKEAAFEKLGKTVRLNYRKAPQFDVIWPLLEEIFAYRGNDLSGFLLHSIRVICRYLDIQTELYLSSELDREHRLKGQERLLLLCEKMGTDDYINATGGQMLYDRKAFEARGMHLYFLRSDLPEYSQFRKEFLPPLSILDVLMLNQRTDVIQMLGKFTLL